MANISDCRSAETGLIPVRTADLQHKRWWPRTGFPNRGRVFDTLMLHQSPDGVMRNIQEFESCVPGSSPGPVSNGGFSLLVKRPSVNRKNRVQFPKSSNTAWCNRQHDHLPLFLRGKHKKIVFSLPAGRQVRVWRSYKTGLSFNGRILCYERRDGSSNLLEPTGKGGLE